MDLVILLVFPNPADFDSTFFSSRTRRTQQDRHYCRIF